MAATQAIQSGMDVLTVAIFMGHNGRRTPVDRTPKKQGLSPQAPKATSLDSVISHQHRQSALFAQVGRHGD